MIPKKYKQLAVDGGNKFYDLYVRYSVRVSVWGDTPEVNVFIYEKIYLKTHVPVRNSVWLNVNVMIQQRDFTVY